MAIDMASDATNQDFIEPTRESRRNLLVLIVVAVLVGAAIKFWAMPAFFAHVASLPRCEQIARLRESLVVLVCTPPLFAVFHIPYAIRMIKLNQAPLPGTWVFVRTPIRRGRVVMLRACLMLLLSLAALAFPLFGLHLLQSTPFAYPLATCRE